MTAIQSTPTEGARSSPLPSLTGLRFVAAMAVFFWHVGNLGVFADKDAGSAYMTVFYQGGWTAVNFYFVLSGFILTWSARPADTARVFWRRRFFRIYPNYLVSLAAAVLVGDLVLLFYRDTGMRLFSGFLNVFMLQAWFPDERIEFGINSIAWSMSVEAFFYLCFPLLVKYVRRIPAKRLWFTAMGLMAAVWMVPLVAQLLPDQPRTFLGPVSRTQYWFVYVFPLTRLFEFVLGMVMARIVMAGRWVRLGALPVALIVLAGYVLPDVLTFLPWSFRQTACSVIPMALLIPTVATCDLAGRWTPFRGQVMVWLGGVSYAFFLLHARVISAAHQWLGSETWETPMAVAVIVFMFVATLTAAGLLFTLVERPVMKRWRSPRRRSAPHIEPSAP
ncbi:acyltransferase family protein [Streptomyces reniochalinae]|uniref:Acyltransferase n=1 Tax=Streptomyces reniochalinae TaxID=2250578 RepID=A0A367EEH2_9ACTN|nr:acyltransferase [Streptomyces reniochalinae]RCG16169.1 acyltransferase [Streptomyces reniochalinae]